MGKKQELHDHRTRRAGDSVPIYIIGNIIVFIFIQDIKRKRFVSFLYKIW